MMELPLVLAWSLGLSGGRAVGGFPGKTTNTGEKKNLYHVLDIVRNKIFSICSVYMIHAKLSCNEP